MADYTQNEDYSAKDALASGDAEKLILGTDIDSEFAEIQTAIDSKYDSSDLATQAQAEAGSNNTTLMTPLRVAQYLGIGGAGGGTAGAIGDILALDDPGDDRIMFWDESVDSVTFLDIGSHLEITAGAVLNVVESGLDHDALTNFVADEHLAHSSISVTAGTALTGGGTIAANRTINFDLTTLTEETSIDATNDDIVFYDASAAAHRKVPIDSIIGSELGEAKYYRTADISITSTITTVAFNVLDGTDTLAKGTYSTSTGQYTAGSDGAVVLVVGHFRIAGQEAGEDGSIDIYKDGSTVVATQLITNRGKFGASTSTQSVTSLVTLAAGETVEVRVGNDGTKTGTAGINSLYINIIELR